MQKNYLTGEFIKGLRNRKGLRQSDILRFDSESTGSVVTVSRVENLRQAPTENTVSEMLEQLDMPYGKFFCPHMEAQREDSILLRNTITRLLYRAEGDKDVQAATRGLIERLRQKLDMDSQINKQLWINLKTTLEVISGDTSDETLEMIIDGLKTNIRTLNSMTSTLMC